MIDTITKPEVDLDPALVADIESAGSVVTDSYTLADALREGGTFVEQVRNSWGGEHAGCAMTAITAAAASHNIQF